MRFHLQNALFWAQIAVLCQHRVSRFAALPAHVDLRDFFGLAGIDYLRILLTKIKTGWLRRPG
jgi:hypothetical protein